VTGFRSFNNSTSKKVPNLLEVGNLRLVGFSRANYSNQVLVNDGGGNDASCGGVNVRVDTTKLSNVVLAGFGDGRSLVGESKMLIKDKAKVASRQSGWY